MTLGRTEMMMEEEPVNIETITAGFAPTKYAKALILKKLAHEYHCTILNENYPIINGTTYSIVKNGDKLVLKAWNKR